MSIKIRTLTLCATALAAALLLAVSLSACRSSYGFGEAIDWELPVLKLTKPSKDPSYVKGNVELIGTVTDNIAVGHIELRHAISGIVLETATLSGESPRSKYWTIKPNFYKWAERLGIDNIDGEKIPVEIIAYDSSGNVGEPRAISLIIDLTPPRVTDVWITRTSSSPMRTAYLKPLEDDPEEQDLKFLETTDLNGEVSANADKYQNGWFYIDALLTEDQTKIENVKLQIYDSRYPETPMFEDASQEYPYFKGKERDLGRAVTAPRWTIKEEEIIARGAALGFQNYETDYYINGKRYYYQVDIIALDKSENASEAQWKLEGQDYFVMWEKGDVPKGFLDPMVGTLFTKGELIPVEFFDDDALLKVYTDLFTKDQWNGNAYVGENNLRIPPGSDDYKLEWLLDKLDKGETIYNWKSDRDYADTPITEQLKGKTPDEKTITIQTGSKDEDYGEFVLFTLVEDKKLLPHDGNGLRETNKDRWAKRKWDITIVDDNLPMIIFDTEDRNGEYGSPEENTFPRLKDGRYFTIKGYTLRQGDSNSPDNKVDTLRMAWIPFGESASAQAALREPVLEVLKNKSGYPTNMPDKVQYWTLDLTDAAGRPESDSSYEADYETIGGISYIKQYFSKEFDIIGENADSTEGQNRHHFHLDSKLENETKLFVFVAIDKMNANKTVDKLLPILGRKTPPKLTVWDISDRDIPTGTTLSPPSIYDYVTGAIDAAARAAYQTALAGYNADSDTYAALKAIYGTGAGAEEANPLQVYPRGKMLRYWVQAEEEGDLAIQSIKLEDITYSSANPINIGYYDPGDSRLSYVETLPENQQKVFRFTATNTLGIPAVIQRTVTITSTSMVIDITTLKPNGTYGISANTNNNAPEDQEDRIAILARFSNMVEWEGTNPPLLNVRYQNPIGTYRVQQVPTITPRSPGTLSLEFRFSVPAGAAGELETMYDNTAMTGAIVGEQVGEINRPITLPEGTRILDVSGEGGGIPAFIPGYTSGSTRTETWKTATNSLQDKKDIMLDGVRPNLVVVSNGAYLPVSGKYAFTPGGGDFYFKSNETITFKLKADKPIRPSGSGNPRIQFYVGDTANGGNQSGPYYATYQRSDENNYAMIFTFPVTNTVTRDGIIITGGTGNNAQYNVSINTANGGIEDTVGNAVSQLVNASGEVQQNTAVPTPVFPTSPATTVYIDQNAPPAPITLLRNASNATVETINGVNTTERLSNVNLNLHINDFTADNRERWALTKWYSLDDGLTWIQYTITTGISLANGTHKIRTRYIDRAGNEGAVSSKTVTINVNFPKLLGINAVKGNGTFNSGNSLSFDLDFADTVNINNAANISLTLADTSNTTNNTDGTNPSYQIALSGTNSVSKKSATTLTFTWSSVNGKDMLNGLKITALNLSGLQDQYENNGPTVTAANITPSNVPFHVQTGVTDAYSVTYDLSRVIVSGIAPVVRTYEPQNAQGRTGNITVFDPAIAGNPTDIATGSISADNKTIRLTFSKPVQRGRGAITVRPHGNYAIPAVIDNNSMSDIYNNMTSAADRNYLITSGTLSSPALSTNTGLSTGPYKKMTHGLKEGNGYTGGTYSGSNAPTPSQASSMIPDTTTKWVLDYQYQIHDTTNNSVVSNIRAALTRMGYRRQDIAVTSTTNVNVSGNTVTITLSEALLPGLQWELFYPNGTFTDMAGNSAPAVPVAADNPYWFWSNGAQTPVIRVDRKSYDARTGNIPNRADPSQNNTMQTDPGTADGYNGSITSFNTVAYRIETETPEARIFYGTVRGAANSGSATGAWEGTAATGYNWAGPKTSNTGTLGTWVQSNLIFRNNNSTTTGYTATENGITFTHYVVGAATPTQNNTTGATFAANYYGFRSFNRDALKSDLDVTLSSNAANNYTSTFTYTALQASKDYVFADARIDHNNAGGTYSSATHASSRGYEGVFRTVIALNQNGITANPPVYILLLGTNVKSGIPTIAGFPVRDGVATGDTRYLKMFNRSGKQYYWVSTEIVSSWYMQTRGQGGVVSTTAGTNPGGSGYGSSGDSTDWITAGYGDLSLGFDVRSN